MSSNIENKRFILNFSIALFLTAAMWLVKLYEVSLNLNFSDYGILPRTLEGLKGIIFSPFIHGSYKHLYSNTFPFLILTTAVLFFHPQKGMIVFFTVYFAGNIIVWLIGREAYHIGSSGIIFGLASYLLFNGIISRNREDLAISLIVIFLYGGLIWGILPQSDQSISWEAHMGGFASGAFMAILLSKKNILINSNKSNIFVVNKYNFEYFSTFSKKTNFYYIYKSKSNKTKQYNEKTSYNFTSSHSNYYEFESPAYIVWEISIYRKR